MKWDHCSLWRGHVKPTLLQLTRAIILSIFMCHLIEKKKKTLKILSMKVEGDWLLELLSLVYITLAV